MASTHQEHGRQRSVSGALTVGSHGGSLLGLGRAGVSGCLSRGTGQAAKEDAENKLQLC